MTIGKENHTAEFLSSFPAGRVPVMETQDGPLFESNAIAYYVASLTPNSPILGQTAYENARILNFMFFFDNEFVPSIYQWYLIVAGYRPSNLKQVEEAQVSIKKSLAMLESHLAHNTFLVGHRVTLADICGVCTLYALFSQCMGPEMRNEFQSVMRWYDLCVNQKNFKEVIGNIELSPKTVTEPKAKPAPVAAKPAAPKDDDNDDEFVEKKAKSAMDLLPQSKFNLDAWKRKYSNEDTRSSAIPWFWREFDPEGYSLWYLEYNHNEELTKQFMVCNLVGGFFHRMEGQALHRYAFGSVLILGQENAFKVQGVMMIRGKEMPQEMLNVPDYEAYTFKQLNPNDANDKKTWDDYIAWDANYSAGKLAEGKIFK